MVNSLILLPLLTKFRAALMRNARGRRGGSRAVYILCAVESTQNNAVENRYFDFILIRVHARIEAESVEGKEVVISIEIERISIPPLALTALAPKSGNFSTEYSGEVCLTFHERREYNTFAKKRTKQLVIPI